MTPRAAVGVALACTLVLNSCQMSPDQRAGQPERLPAGPQVVEVDLAEYRFEYDPAIAAGRVLFRVTNTGSVAHSLTVLPLGEDIPPIDQQLRGGERRAITPFAGVGARRPGTSTTFAVNLEPGARYAFVCFLVDAQGKAHSLRGMSSEFRTAGTAPAAPAPTTSSPALSS